MPHPLVTAFDDWLVSSDGLSCNTGQASGVYLENRLQRAFEAGWEAREKEARREQDSAALKREGE